jgi:hypothetical protein
MTTVQWFLLIGGLMLARGGGGDDDFAVAFYLGDCVFGGGLGVGAVVVGCVSF